MPTLFDTGAGSAKPALTQRRDPALKAEMALAGKRSIDRRPSDVGVAG